MKRLFYTALFLILLTANVYSQSATDASNSQSLELKISSLEQSYDSQIYLLLSNYFDRKKFFVDATINAEFVDETVERTQNQVTSSTRIEPVIMPGLPFLPQENLRSANSGAQTPETVVNESTIRTLRLINITISIFADTSFSTQEVQFMSLLTGIAAKTNDARGDQITIAQIPIPTVGTVDPIPIIQAPQEPESILASFRSYIPGFVLLILFGAIMFLSRFFNKPEDRSTQLQQRESIKHDISISDFNRPMEQVLVNNSEGRDISIEIDELINNFFNKSKEIALLIEYWLDENKEEGAFKAAEVIASVDKQLLRAIKNDLQPENFELIKDTLETLSPMMSERKSSVIRSFNSVLRSGSQSSLGSKKNGHITLFKFLDHISDAQIVDLLNDEGYQTGALIVDYLPEDKAARVLDRIEKSRSANIMLKMTTIGSIPYQLQSEISSKLFDKAMDLIDNEKEQRLGAENILPILDKLPLNEQQDYIDQLKATNSVVGEVVQRQFITINQVLTLTDDIIKEAVQDIDTSTLLDALLGLDQKLTDKFLSVRPKREQRLIRLELDELKDKPLKDTNEAKSEIMKRIRSTVKKSQNIT